MVQLCPVRAIDFLLSSFPDAGQGPLFVYVKAGSVIPLLYKDIRQVIRSWALSLGLNPKSFGSHSARSGSATTAFKGGVGEVGIMKLGDWLSNTFLTYIKQDLADIMQIQMKMLGQLQKDVD